MTAETRRCTRCQQVLPLTKLWRDKRARGGRNGMCGGCSQRARHDPPPPPPPAKVVALVDLFDTPLMPDAACLGRHQLFDPVGDDEHPEDHRYRADAAKAEQVADRREG